MLSDKKTNGDTTRRLSRLIFFATCCLLHFSTSQSLFFRRHRENNGDNKRARGGAGAAADLFEKFMQGEQNDSASDCLLTKTDRVPPATNNNGEGTQRATTTAATTPTTRTAEVGGEGRGAIAESSTIITMSSNHGSDGNNNSNSGGGSGTATTTTAFSSGGKGKQTLLRTLKLGFYFFLFYFFSVCYNVSNKRVLNEFPLPCTVAVTQIILGIPLFLPAWLLRRPNYESIRTILPALCKISFLHALGNVATVVSLQQGAVSFTQIIKASEPVFSAGLSAVLLGSVFPLSVYVTLVPIVFGVAMASAKEFTFSWTGFLAGMASNLFYQMRIVLAKKELSGDSQTALSPANFFRVVTLISAMELLPIAITLEGSKIRSSWLAAQEAGINMENLKANILISGFSYYLYNEVAFWILGSIHPVSHAVGNTIKRVVIIMASIIILKSPISREGVIGSTIAVAGTLAYSLAQHFATANDPTKKTMKNAIQF